MLRIGSDNGDLKLPMKEMKRKKLLEANCNLYWDEYVNRRIFNKGITQPLILNQVSGKCTYDVVQRRILDGKQRTENRPTERGAKATRARRHNCKHTKAPRCHLCFCLNHTIIINVSCVGNPRLEECCPLHDLWILSTMPPNGIFSPLPEHGYKL